MNPALRNLAVVGSDRTRVVSAAERVLESGSTVGLAVLELEVVVGRDNESRISRCCCTMARW